MKRILAITLVLAMASQHLLAEEMDFGDAYEYSDEFMEEYGDRRMWLATTKGGRNYTDVSYRDEDMILFGRETAGLPRDFIAAHSEQAVRIPMSKDTRLRSFNLSNSVIVVLFEALRQLDFPGLE